MKKIKWRLIAAAVMAIILCLCAASCSRRGAGDESAESADIGESESGAQTEDDGDREMAEAKAKYDRLITPTPRDGKAIKDGVIYGKYDDVSKGGLIANLGERFSKLMYFVSSDGGEPVLLCNDESCEHKDIGCAAVRLPGTFRGEINVT